MNASESELDAKVIRTTEEAITQIIARGKSLKTHQKSVWWVSKLCRSTIFYFSCPCFRSCHDEAAMQTLYNRGSQHFSNRGLFSFWKFSLAHFSKCCCAAIFQYSATCKVETISKKKRGLRTRGRRFLRIFKRSQKKKVITPNTSTFCKKSYDFKEKGSHRANTTFSNQIALWPTAKCSHGSQVENYCSLRCLNVSYCWLYFFLDPCFLWVLRFNEFHVIK